MSRFKNVIKNISYTVTSNLISLFVSTIVTLFLPRVLGVSDYGYYQLYLFYVSYVGFLHLGWCDGIYLRYGGEEYGKLDKPKLKGQFYSLLFMQVIISLVFLMIIFFQNTSDHNKYLVMYAVISNIVILNMRNFILLILQTTNRLKEYSFITILDRLFFVSTVILLLIFGVKDFQFFICADILGKLVSFIYSFLKVRQITFFHNPNPNFDLKESIINIKVGINLMLANIASSLIIGIVRFGVQYKWDVATFGKISLTLSISNLLMVFINAVSLSIFPLLKKIDRSKYKTTYPLIRNGLMPVIFIVLLSYYPISIVLSKWLPQYEMSLRFMAIAFPIVVFDSKVGLLTNTFLKAMRKEKEIFKINLITALLSLCITYLAIIVLDSIIFTVLSIVILVAVRSTLAEIILNRELSMNIYRDIIMEYMLVMLFIISGWYFYGLIGMLMYILGLLLYLYLKKSDLKDLFKQLTGKG
ncbi:oligosaccharide flippase family protein [Enterococcus phoeniculicola]|jgi:O-antigen/teichoic acid export membrane protein|uniref:Polysaccharide biosynthesis protein C-terminal domain-containing protein n=1 Tax=Enterococcus phoeniculicola ATCC BAA-412 TaxID=1158610 RepID=R3W9E0_9ENTE|nr:oligosaccharide flippase family protein [Enterococcus phoeniculicola]EOL44077.1 hypothetical protein UC3_01707 [Enterococcus phoeniculicola ATCC BAA-412]EOT75179.1 hypothetical protein I589_02779 [Enterococcus phoeniculicola ATCC BAA-412]